MKRITIVWLTSLAMLAFLQEPSVAQKDDSGLNDLLNEIGGTGSASAAASTNKARVISTSETSTNVAVDLTTNVPPAVSTAVSTNAAASSAVGDKTRLAAARGDIQAALVQPDSKMISEAQLLAQQEEIRLQARAKMAQISISAGIDALHNGNYDDAIKNLGDGVRNMPAKLTSEKQLEAAKEALVEAYLQKAGAIVDASRKESPGEAIRDMDTADGLVTDAGKILPSNSDVEAMHSRIASNIERLRVVMNTPVPVNKTTDYLNKQDAIRNLADLGRQYMRIKDYDSAETKFKTILQMDEYNAEAMTYLHKIYELRYQAHTLEREATVEHDMDEVRSAWSPPLRVEIAPPIPMEGGGTNLVSPTLTLQQRLEDMVIPELEFNGAKINDVIDFLETASQQVDPSKIGVNIILLQLPPNEAQAPATSGALPADGGVSLPGATPDTSQTPSPAAGVAAQTSSTAIPPVTLKVRRITLLSAIKYICEETGLKYRLEGDNTVKLMPLNMTTEPIITRTYPVQPSFIPTISSKTSSDTSDNGGGDTTAGGNAITRMDQGGTISTGNIKAFFEKMGVPFPAGSSISYNAGISKLIVANTAENLEKLENLLPEFNLIPSQVEIETRFVDVNEADLEELGAEWGLAEPYVVASKNSGGPIGSTQQIALSTPAAGGLTEGLRFFNFDSSSASAVPVSGASATSQDTPMGGILKIAGILTNPELNVVLHALSQHGATDLLSAPRVTTKSGQNAQIEVVQEMIYPTEFQSQQPQYAISSIGGSTVVTPPTVTPSAFQTREVGVILNVLPTVSPDGYTIDLSLQPEVSELGSWINYGSTYGDITVNIPQPIFSVRKVNTSLTIWDGQTVVMGGLIREEMTKTKDKVPLLGDIPLLGHLFQSDGEQSQKENLLIFVSARLVSPSGVPIHRASSLGVAGGAGNAGSGTGISNNQSGP